MMKRLVTALILLLVLVPSCRKQEEKVPEEPIPTDTEVPAEPEEPTEPEVPLGPEVPDDALPQEPARTEAFDIELVFLPEPSATAFQWPFATPLMSEISASYSVGKASFPGQKTALVLPEAQELVLPLPALGKQVVAGEAGGDLNDRSGLAELLDVGHQQNFNGHAEPPLGQKAHVAGAAHTLLDCALLHRGDARDAGGLDLAELRHVVAEQLDVVQVDFVGRRDLRHAADGEVRAVSALGAIFLLIGPLVFISSC